jgi:hypothetical protein
MVSAFALFNFILLQMTVISYEEDNEYGDYDEQVTDAGVLLTL